MPPDEAPAVIIHHVRVAAKINDHTRSTAPFCGPKDACRRSPRLSCAITARELVKYWQDVLRQISITLNW
jgi:hypothetical protein